MVIFFDQCTADFLITVQHLMEFRRPSDSEYTSVHNYLDNIKPIHKTERSYISHKDDIISLKPKQQHGFLGQAIEYALRKLHQPAPWLTVSSMQGDVKLILMLP